MTAAGRGPIGRVLGAGAGAGAGWINVHASRRRDIWHVNVVTGAAANIEVHARPAARLLRDGNPILDRRASHDGRFDLAGEIGIIAQARAQANQRLIQPHQATSGALTGLRLRRGRLSFGRCRCGRSRGRATSPGSVRRRLTGHAAGRALQAPRGSWLGAVSAFSRKRRPVQSFASAMARSIVSRCRELKSAVFMVGKSQDAP